MIIPVQCTSSCHFVSVYNVSLNYSLEDILWTCVNTHTHGGWMHTYHFYTPFTFWWGNNTVTLKITIDPTSDSDVCN